MEELYTLLASLGKPVCYGAFSKPQVPPYIIYEGNGTRNFFADGKTYYKVQDVEIYLYTDKKDTTLESQLETALNNADYAWEIASETYLPEEKLYEVVYEISL